MKSSCVFFFWFPFPSRRCGHSELICFFFCRILSSYNLIFFFLRVCPITQFLFFSGLIIVYNCSILRLAYCMLRTYLSIYRMWHGESISEFPPTSFSISYTFRILLVFKVSTRLFWTLSCWVSHWGRSYLSHPVEISTSSVARLPWLAAVHMGCLACLASVRAVLGAKSLSCFFLLRSVLQGLCTRTSDLLLTAFNLLAHISRRNVDADLASRSAHAYF